MATRTISNSGGTRSWADPLSWVEGAVPTQNDDVVATASSGNLTIGVTAYCKSIDLTGYTGTFSPGARLHVYGSLKFVNTMTLGGSWGIEFNGSPSGATIETGGNGIRGLIINGTGDWTLLDDWNVFGGANITVTAGHLDLSNRTIGYWLGSFISTGSATRSTNLTNTTIILGVGNWNVNGSSNLTLTGSTIKLEGYNFQFNGYGLSYNNVIFGGSDSEATGNCIITVSGNNTFQNLTILQRSGYTTTVKFTAGTTQTINGTFTATGTVSNKITLNSVTSGSQFNLSKSSGTVTVSYCTIKDSNATGGATWDADDGTNIDNGNNTGWDFTPSANFLRIYDGTNTIYPALEYPATSKLRISKSGIIYGITLCSITDTNASTIRIFDGANTMALLKQ